MKQPAIICIARHGNRLDQVDRSWSETADKPYDPPLTYGGWIQCQILGARIANEIKSIPISSPTKSEQDGDVIERPLKRRRVVIHSSPYLRCLQTSIAIGAGLRELKTSSRPIVGPQRSSLSKEVTGTIKEEDEDGKGIGVHTEPGKSKLRVDAFLGEWLNPGYFEETKPPPPSEELLSSAKQYLKTPAQEIKGVDFTASPIAEFTAIDWDEKEMEASAKPVHEKTGLRAMAAAGHAMAKRPRHLSLETGPRSQVKKAITTGYAPPIPIYSIAPQDSIPIGFVAHARDQCIDIDMSWDSMKEPNCGDGGAYAEEWGAMHRRFRNGLQELLGYYEEQTSDDEELVVVLVTHQAGCNALIRLLTGAPALHDIGTSSLTMAVRRKDGAALRKVRSNDRRGSVDLGVADDFEMKIIASTEHLRAGSNPLGLNSPRLGKSPAFASRRMVGADSPEGFSLGDPAIWKPSGGLARSQSTRSYLADEPSVGIVNGLWNSQPGSPSLEPRGRNASISYGEVARASEAESEGGGLWSGQPDPNADRRGSISYGEVARATADEGMWGASPPSKDTSLPVRSASQRGLWGGESAIVRSKSPGKRRWTAVDRSP